jgi:hypothetical protein
MAYVLQDEHKRTLLFQNNTENKYGILNFSRTPVDKELKVLFQMTRVIVGVARLR